jgi:Lipoprotein confined to pathogenic Mycobacterium
VTVSVADIDRWDAGDVREVFHAARSRAEAAFEARDGIATLPAFGTWGGDAARGWEATATFECLGTTWRRSWPDFQPSSSCSHRRPRFRSFRWPAIYRCRKRHREADVAKTVKSFIALALIGLVITTGCGSGSDSHQKDDGMSTSQSSDPAAGLRTKPSFEAAQQEYRNAMQDMATRVAALVPGLTWQTKEDSWRGCGGQYAQTAGVQVYVYIVFAGSVPEDKWTPALEIVKDGAARLGATNITTLVDKPGDRDVMFGGADGIEIEFGTKANTILSAKSDCRLRQADLPASN